MPECLKCVVYMSCGISKCEIKFNQMPGNTCTIRYANRFSSGRLIATGNIHMRNRRKREKKKLKYATHSPLGY